MDNNVLRFSKLVMTDDCHVTSEKVVIGKPSMDGLASEEFRGSSTRLENTSGTDESASKFRREVCMHVSISCGCATAKISMAVWKDTFTKCCFEANRRWMELAVWAIVP